VNGETALSDVAVVSSSAGASGPALRARTLERRTHSPPPRRL